MKLKSYIDQFPRHKRKAERERLAQVLGVSEITIRSWANDNRRVPAEQAIPLERATYKAVRRIDTRPDVFIEETAA